MDKDILFVFLFLVFFIILILFLQPKNKENFVNNSKEKDLEPENAFDASINNISGDENHGVSFDDENNEKTAEIPNKKAQVIVFLSKTCPHCIVYDNHKFKRLKGKLEKLTKGNISIKKIYADNDPKGLFNKYDIQFIPAGVVVYNGKQSKISGEISPSNALKTIHNISQ